ncbi:mannose-1-phosphate guanylyltransferase [Malassezia brasiliensis]|uniref:Mannose-1-phosphate guanylyltransferase n=1 Tax=Malassezia brasiliensis TaxID=1821822 RepID=A0AAF0DRX0_9BASI|nr:mannose-1-phosphate guanylyltransferase [Malassezia brasiliensis]
MASQPGQTSGPQDNAVLNQILAGISDLRRDVHRVTERLDMLEMQQPPTPTMPVFSPSISPSKRNTYFAHQTSLNSWHPERNRPAPPPSSSVTHIAPPSPVSLKATDPELGLWAVVPAGGAGTRLWPLSRESCPKFLLDLTGQGRTLIQNTWDRLLPLSGVERFMVVTGNAHVDAVAEQLPQLVPGNVFAEPSPKESMAAIGLAAAVLMRRDPNAVLGSFAADHIVSGRDAFESAVREAVAVAKEGFLVTIGIAPSYPSTGFGYIKLGESLELKDAPNAHKVLEFKEKPDARTASAYLSTGEYRWNGGMFVVKAKTLMSLLEANVPELYAGLNTIAEAWDTPSRQLVLNEQWPLLPKIAIDHAVAEPASRVGKVAVVPATFGWDDVGDFASLSDLLPAEKNEARVLGDPSLVITEGQVGGIVVPASGRQVACLGMDDVVVVDTPDALLITTRARSQDVKKIVAKCKKTHPELC